jgi:hypothetical protein
LGRRSHALTLQGGATPGTYTDVQTITGPGEYLVPLNEGPRKFCRLRY